MEERKKEKGKEETEKENYKLSKAIVLLIEILDELRSSKSNISTSESEFYNMYVEDEY